MASCGVCGSDVHCSGRTRRLRVGPATDYLGHEFSGTVESVGSGVTGGLGDRVVAVAIQGCGRCETCLAGSAHSCVPIAWPPAFPCDGGWPSTP